MNLEAEPSSTPDFLSGGGTMGSLLRSHDWSGTALGSPDTWPHALRIAVRVMLNTRHPIYIFWGPDHLCFYNDAFSASIGPERHPGSLGLPAASVWHEAWEVIGPQIEQVMSGQGATWHENQLVPITRGGKVEEVYWTYSHAPIDDGQAPCGVGGVLVICTETTEMVLAERRRQLELRRQRSLFDQAPGFIIVMRGPEHVVDFVNESHRKLFGSEGWIGKPIRQAVPDLASQGFFELLDGVYRSGLPYRAHSANVNFRRPGDGQHETRIVDFVNSPVFDEAGAVSGVFGEGLDITDRIRAEQALRESEDRFGEVANAAPVLIWMSDTTKACVWFNKPWLAFTGRSLEQERGDGWAEGVHPDDFERCVTAYAEAFDRRVPFRVDYRLRRADGQWRTVDDNGAPRFSRDGVFLGYIGSCIDVTDQRRTEQALRDSEEQLRLATEAAEVGAWDVDIVNDTLYWPARVKAMFGVSPHVDVSIDDFYSGVHPDDRDAVTAAYLSAADPQSRVVYDVEYRTVGKEDGVVRWVAAKGRGIFDADGRCVRMIGTAIDITRRKRDEAQLRQSKAELDVAVAALRRLNETLEEQVASRTAELDRVWRNSRDLLVVMGEDGTLTSVSPSWETILGHDPGDVLGRPLTSFIWSGDAPPAPSDTSGPEPAAEEFECQYRHRDGTPRWISWRTAREQGAVFAYGRDVTVDKQRQADLARAQDALRQAQKMEAVGRLTGGIAHDFNNLLQGIAGNFELIRRKADDAGRVRQWAESGIGAVTRASKLTGQLLAFSRAQTLTLKPLNIARLVSGLADLLVRTIGPAVRIEFDLHDRQVNVVGDDTQLEMAVLNLAINARDAMPDGGRLRIGTRHRNLPAEADLAAGDYIELTLEDTGAGMSPEVAAKAFDPFFTTKGVGKGTGLGLSQVYGTMRQAGGAVRIESAAGAGTIVRLYLPCTPEAAALDASPDAGETLPVRRTKVLVIDDDREVRAVFVDYLQSLGHDVLEAEDGYAGIAAFERSAPDLIVVDFAMPGITGAQVAEAVRMRRPNLPIIFSSGFADTAAIERLPGPRTPLLRKPFSLQELGVLISDVLNTA